MSRGGYRDGAGRPPGTPNRVTREIRELLGPLDEVAGDRLKVLIDSDDQAIALKATELVLGYLHGKPRNEVKIEAHSAPQILSPQELEDLPANVLRKILSGQRIKPEDYEGLPPEVLRRIAGIDEVKAEGQQDDERE